MDRSFDPDVIREMTDALELACDTLRLTMFIAFCLDLKSPGWAMTTVYLTSQPLSGVLRAKAVYRTVGTFIGGAATVAIVPNLVDAPELTTLAIILWVAWATLASSAGIIVSVRE